MNRREFMRNSAITMTAAGISELKATTEQEKIPISIDSLPRVGPKKVVKGKNAVASSDNPIVTETMLQVMKDGGNAVDAAVAGCLVQATVAPHMTNHTGTVMFLYWEAKTGKAYTLDSSGTIVPGMPPFRPVPPGLGVLNPGPMAPMGCIPGFMPGLNEMHKKFGTKTWSSLCQPAIQWADEGFPISSFQHSVLDEELPLYAYFPEGRELFTPDGFVPSVGDRLKNPKLAETLRKLSSEGPEYFTKGEWAKHFVAEANKLGWMIKLDHLTEVPPRWDEPLKWEYNGYEVLQFGPPQRQALFTAYVLNVLNFLNIKSLGHHTKSAETLYYFAHAMRRAEFELGMLHDPQKFEVPLDIWTSKDFYRMAAEILKRSLPKVDLTEHVKVTSGNPALIAAGIPTGKPDKPVTHIGSCELSIVDHLGNWVQMMNTLQSGGIPGAVVDGVIMVGSHAQTNMESSIAGWFSGGCRMRSVYGSTIVLKDGRPILSMGTPGNVHCTIPQVLSNVLDFGMDPYDAADAPRMLPIRSDYTIEIESRIPLSVLSGLLKLGIQVRTLPMYDYRMGSFQMCWRDEKSGLLNTCADPRRAGFADGF
jgi:gamma-glutamyltranspeptidase / glutathione hydrolase